MRNILLAMSALWRLNRRYHGVPGLEAPLSQGAAGLVRDSAIRGLRAPTVVASNHLHGGELDSFVASTTWCFGGGSVW